MALRVYPLPGSLTHLLTTWAMLQICVKNLVNIHGIHYWLPCAEGLNSIWYTWIIWCMRNHIFYWSKESNVIYYEIPLQARSLSKSTAQIIWNQQIFSQHNYLRNDRHVVFELIKEFFKFFDRLVNFAQVSHFILTTHRKSDSPPPETQLQQRALVRALKVLMERPQNYCIIISIYPWTYGAFR